MTDNVNKADILICEDEVLIAADLESRLNGLGYTVCGKAVSAMETLELFERRRPDLVIMDISLNGKMDGIDAAEAIRDKWDVPVIFLTGYTDTDRLERAKLSYPFGYLLKPFQNRDLKVTIEMALYVADVDRQRREEEELRRESEERLKLFMDHLPGVAFLKDPEGVVVFANERYYEAAGLQRSEVEGKAYRDYLEPEIAEAFRREDALILADNKTLELEHVFPTAEGDTYWLTKKFPIKSGGQGSLIGGISIDITDRNRAEEALRDSEEKFRSISEQMIETVFVTDRQGVITHMSPVAQEIFGFRADEMVNRPFTEFLAEESIEYAFSAFMDLLEKDIAVGDIRLWMKRKDGTIFSGELSAKIYRQQGAITGTIGVIRDITEQCRAEKQIQTALKEKVVLLKELNHRVKNNMQVIISLMKLQADKLNDEKIKAVFLESQARIHAMAAVHESLHQSDNLSSIDLSSYILKLCVTTFQVYGTDTGNINLSVEINPARVKLEQSYPIGLVINELLSNALKYAFPDNRQGMIEITGGPDGKNGVGIVISDNGVGMPVDFEFRNANSLGLQLVKSLVENQLRGAIHLNTDRGTQWSITFPAPE